MYVGPDPEDYQPLIDWGIFTEPIPGANGRRFHYAQGKTLGVCNQSAHMVLSEILTLAQSLGQFGAESGDLSQVHVFHEFSR
jgi:hypothetical protein